MLKDESICLVSDAASVSKLIPHISKISKKAEKIYNLVMQSEKGDKLSKLVDLVSGKHKRKLDEVFKEFAERTFIPVIQNIEPEQLKNKSEFKEFCDKYCYPRAMFSRAHSFLELLILAVGTKGKVNNQNLIKTISQHDELAKLNSYSKGYILNLEMKKLYNPSVCQAFVNYMKETGIYEEFESMLLADDMFWWHREPVYICASPFNNLVYYDFVSCCADKELQQYVKKHISMCEICSANVKSIVQEMGL